MLKSRLIVTAALALAMTAPAAAQTVLTVSSEQTTTYVRNFNPFNQTSARATTKDFIYEPLAIFNRLAGAKWEYRLAESFELADDLKSISFKLRDGLKWSDGQPLTVDDVVFTYDYLKKFPALDFNSVSKLMESVEKVDEHTVRFNLIQPNSLVATTIVESGLDIPSANTLIVHRADRFGLAQLYQIRGRVGRAKTRAYAYLTTPADQQITEGAEKRLQVLSALDTLGAGFQLASHDLDQRGAGNLLGDEQSGHIKEIGFELYQSMLEEAILEAQATARGVKPPADAFSPQITAEVPILIPEDYVPDLNVRMALYRRLNEMQGRQDIDGFAAEMIDRFGPLPSEAANLLAIIEIKLACLTAGVAKLEAGIKGGLITFQNDSFANPEGLLQWLDRLGARAKVRPDQKLFIAADWSSDSARLKGALQLAVTLSKLASGATLKPATPKPAPIAKPLPPRPNVFKAKVKGR